MIYWTHCGKVASAVAVPTSTGKLWALRSTARQCCLSLECNVRAGMRGARWDAWFTLGCVVHAGMRGSRWYAWCTLGCVVRAGMRGVKQMLTPPLPCGLARSTATMG